ncbi:MAG: hypothetical protein ACYTG0_29280 [Planctomycetota bacterium]|jgi:hypothetical protein
MRDHLLTNRFLRLAWLPAVLAIALVGPSLAAAAEEPRDYDPHIMYVFPAGAPKGATVEGIMIRGRGLEGSNEVRISGGGVTAEVVAIEEPDSRLTQRSRNRLDQSENPNVVKIKVTVAADAEPGGRDLWLITPKGATNRFRFIVGQVPEVKENDENNEIGQAQTLESLPVLVNGQIFQADRDFFRFQAKAGETIVCEVQGQTIVPYIPDAVPGWLQACLTLYDASGNEVAYVDDFRFRPDPVLIYRVETDGEYLIEVKDVLFRGREDLVYRMSIGALPFITHIYPLGGPRDSNARIELFGVNLPETTTSLELTGDCPPKRSVKANGKGLTSNSLPFAVGDTPEAHEAEPNDSVEKPQRIEAPVTINGRIQEGGDADYFLLSAKAKDQLVMNVRARRLESPLDSILTLYSATGQQLAENDDTVDLSEGLITHHADSYLTYTIRTDGDYVVRIGDVQGLGGEEYAYRLSVAPPKPDFNLSFVPANVSVAQGATALAKVKAYRQDGFNGQISVAFEGLPKGCVASPVVIPARQTEARLTITAPPDVATTITTPTVVGTATIGDQTVRREAFPAEELMQAFYYWHDVPTDEFLMTVVKPTRYALSTSLGPAEILQIPRGGNTEVVVKVARREGSKEQVRLAADTPPRGVTVRPANIATGKNEATVTITVTNQAAIGLRDNVILTGTMRVGKNNVTAVAPAIPIEVVDPAKVAAKKVPPKKVPAKKPPAKKPAPKP